MTGRGDPPPLPNLGSNVPPAMVQTYNDSIASPGYQANRERFLPTSQLTVTTNANGQLTITGDERLCPGLGWTGKLLARSAG